MTVIETLVEDLRAETRVVDDLLQPLRPGDWAMPTPAEGWCIADQVSHLAFFDDVSVTAATDPGAFRIERAELLSLGDAFPDRVAERYRHLGDEELLAWFRSSRHGLLRQLGRLDPKQRMPWFGPDMSITSCLTARLMETWAHGQDIADALGVTRLATDRIRHVAHLGVRTMGFSFGLRHEPVPERPVRVELTAPSGELWTWGESGLDDVVRGPALDFCLVVTQRRHRSQTALVAEGSTADAWLDLAQAYAGAPGPGRPAPVLEESR
jgi:uncharacterized protein (TIGR03084 family)